MTSFAIHLFIDAFPAGWMKAIMDVERQPKPAYFAYRDALEPLMTSLRTDRCAYYAGESLLLEAWVCNDRHDAPVGTELRGMLLQGERLLASCRWAVDIPLCSATMQGQLRFAAPGVTTREILTVRLALCDDDGHTLHDTSLAVEVFPRRAQRHPGLPEPSVMALGREAGPAQQLARELGLTPLALHDPDAAAERPELVLIDDAAQLAAHERELLAWAEAGTRIVALELAPGCYDLLGEQVEVQSSSMLPLHFVSRQTGHRLVADFRPDDFRLWYSPEAGMIAPLLHHTFTTAGMAPVLLSGNTDAQGEWGPALAAADKPIGRGSFALCQLTLAGRCDTNPVAAEFAARFLGLSPARSIR